ncbi:TIGR02646 family protein [Stigmatella aurantiaca]|uniref:TIGR02646 family protein n=1 Tax=Stigmatella aurantiaca TaxID=41 RepID=A0A1H8AYB8_STIAU|nr:retron system putative HNH endonuclease [Stigmatella aurantiaca]SEM75730.1 TIGR02646 family protein [Stigmatella aurantiaca]
MRPILKSPEPATFTAWKGGLASVPGWNHFTQTFPLIKRDLKAALLQEQFQVCCYCERDIAGGAHIEHLVPKSLDPGRTYDYSNLLASCEGERAKGRPPETCGHLKDNAPLSVHPLMPDCSSYFVFSSSGNVSPSPDAAKQQPAQDSITTLGLDSARLVALRRVALEDVDSRLPSPGNTPEDRALFRAEVTKLIAEYSAPDAQGRLTPFSTALVQYLERYL